jgi:hypothetical protein
MLIIAKAPRLLLMIMLFFYPTQINFDIDNNKKQKKLYEMKHHFRDTWVAKLP